MSSKSGTRFGGYEVFGGLGATAWARCTGHILAGSVHPNIGAIYGHWLSKKLASDFRPCPAVSLTLCAHYSVFDCPPTHVSAVVRTDLTSSVSGLEASVDSVSWTNPITSTC
jgi:hypothetical protein